MHRFFQTQSPITGRFSRRALLSAFASVPVIGAATAAAGSLSVLPATETPEHISERVRRLARELSAAMVDWNADIGGAWKAHVYAAGTRAHPIEFQNLDERDDLPQRHAEKLAASMRAMHGGEWRVTVDHEHGFALIVEDRSRAS